MILKHSAEPSPEVSLRMPILGCGGEEDKWWTPGDNGSAPRLLQLHKNKYVTGKAGPRALRSVHTCTLDPGATCTHDQRQSSSVSTSFLFLGNTLLKPCTPTLHLNINSGWTATADKRAQWQQGKIGFHHCHSRSLPGQGQVESSQAQDSTGSTYLFLERKKWKAPTLHSCWAHSRVVLSPNLNFKKDGKQTASSTPQHH